MSIYVVDTSVAAKWFLEEADTAAARRLLNEQDRLHAPDFFLIEFDRVVSKRVQRNEITVSEGHTIRLTLRRFPVKTHPFQPLLDLAYEIAVGNRQSLYDCLYVALAASLEAPMVTADRRLLKRLGGSALAKHLVWVGDIP